ncbi:hypothetical protein PsYK624_104400 [Phanerochaete sordida]|uniref:DUF6593 domain-containing protein n=1 Tax=Phanerochaete sordida TaxID=48140 RepID=A0A9P3LG73_9APHY|nr:hypothetical protein PsYK624_104400 [Phanerochaete sordida]
MQGRSLPFYLEDRTGHVADSDFDDMYDRLFLRVAPHAAVTAPPFARTSSASSALSTLSEESALSEGPADPSAIGIFNTGRRSSTREYLSGRRTSRSLQRPAALLEFGRHGALGTVVFEKSPERRVQIGQWLRKTGMFSGSLSRKFTAADGREYRWIHRPSEGTEWMLVTAPSSLGVPSAPLSSSPSSTSFLSSSPLSSSPLSSSPSSMSSMPEMRDIVVASYALKPPSKPAYNTSGNVLMINEAWAGIAAEILASLVVMRHIAAHGL